MLTRLNEINDFHGPSITRWCPIRNTVDAIIYCKLASSGRKSAFRYRGSDKIVPPGLLTHTQREKERDNAKRARHRKLSIWIRWFRQSVNSFKRYFSINRVDVALVLLLSPFSIFFFFFFCFSFAERSSRVLVIEHSLGSVRKKAGSALLTTMNEIPSLKRGHSIFPSNPRTSSRVIFYHYHTRWRRPFHYARVVHRTMNDRCSNFQRIV